MKKISFLILILITFVNVQAQQTYYWVAGVGDWSNLDNWATTSGGTERFGVLPGATDNVVFDENSYPEGSRIGVNFDVEININDFTATNLSDAEHNIRDRGGKLSITGDVNLDPNFSINAALYFSSSATSNLTMNAGEILSSLIIDGGGTLILQDSVSLRSVTLQNASTLDFNGQSLVVSNDLRAFDATLTSFAPAKIYVSGNFNPRTNTTVNLPTTTIYAGSGFTPNGHSYYRLIVSNARLFGSPGTFEKIITTGGTLEMDNSPTDSLIINTSKLQLTDGSTLDIGYLEINGSRSELAEVEGGVNQSTLNITNKASIEYGGFKNINITSTETVVANNSLDRGNNTGFTINELSPLDYYWVGGDGDIHDISHWATSTGGSVNHGELFSSIDNIIFDENSTNGDALITATDDIRIKNLLMTNITDSIEFDFGFKPIILFGKIELDRKFKTDRTFIRFYGSEAATHYMGSTAKNLFSVDFYEGEHSFSDDSLRFDRNFIRNGTVHFEDKYVETGNLGYISGHLNCRNSTIRVRDRLTGENNPNGTDYTDSRIYLNDRISESPRIDVKGDTLSYVEMGDFSRLFSANCDTIAIRPGISVDLLGSITVDALKIDGEADNIISITGFSDAKIISRNEKDLDASYVSLTNVLAEGATITADLSIDRGGNDGWTFTNEIILPDVPTGLATVEITSDSYKATWDEMPGAESYLFSYTSGGAPAGTNATETTDNFFVLERAGTANQWYVAAKNGAGVSSYSALQQVRFVPRAPTLITNFTLANSASIEITRGNRSDVIAYIDLALDENFTNYVGVYENLEVALDNASNEANFIFESLQESTDYYCRVRITNQSGTSENSETLSFSTIEVLNQSIAFPAIPTKTILDDPFELEVSATSGLEVTVTSSDSQIASVDGKTVTIHSLGEVTFTANQAGNDGFKPAEVKTQDLIITKASQVIVFEELGSKTFGDPSFDLIATGGASANEITYASSDESVATITGNTVSIVGAGVTNITVSQAGNDNYNAAEDVVQQLVVGKADQSITFSTISDKVYGDEDFTVVASTTSGLPINYSITDGPASVSNNSIEINGAGEVTVQASQPGNSNYRPTSISQTFTVAKAALKVTAPTLTRTYGEMNPPLSMTYEGFVNGDEVTDITPPQASTTADITSDVLDGGYVISLSGGNADNYELELVTGRLIIEKAVLTATANDVQRAFGTVNPELTINYVGFKNGDTEEDITPPTASTTAVETSSYDIYPITLSGGSDNNYSLELVNGTLTIEKAVLIASANHLSTVYGQDMPNLTLSYSGFINGDTEANITPPTLSTEAVAGSIPGTYNIAVAGGQADNYELVLEDGILTISQALLNVTAIDNVTIYGEEIPELAIEYDGFVGDDTETVLDVAPTATVAADAFSDAGIYTIDVVGGQSNLYEFEYEPGVFEIQKGTATITIAELEQAADGEQQMPSITTDPVGLTYTITYDGSTEPPSLPGEYTVEISITDPNYEGSISAQLIITPSVTAVEADPIKVSIYPNPARSWVRIEGINSNSTATILSMEGRSIRRFELSSVNQIIPLEGLTKGIYLLRITSDSDDSLTLKRLIIE